jgi:hypothetical protein
MVSWGSLFVEYIGNMDDEVFCDWCVLWLPSAKYAIWSLVLSRGACLWVACLVCARISFKLWWFPVEVPTFMHELGFVFIWRLPTGKSAWTIESKRLLAAVEIIASVIGGSLQFGGWRHQDPAVVAVNRFVRRFTAKGRSRFIRAGTVHHHLCSYTFRLESNVT